MNKLNLVISNEYFMSIKKRSFIFSTIFIPIIFFVLIFIQYYFGSETIDNMSKTVPEVKTEQITSEDIRVIIALVSTTLLWFFLMFYGAQLFNSVRYEKSNRIVEIIISSVKPHTFMLGKIIAVGLVGLTQIFIWLALLFVIILCIASNSIPTEYTVNQISIMNLYDALSILPFGIFSFIGGYLLYGALYAAMGSLLDSDNDNQSYMAFITIILMMSMYAGIAVIEQPTGTFAELCTYIPFTSPIILLIRIVHGIVWWKILLSYSILFSSCWVSIYISGKIYSAGILLKGKHISISNIISFIKG
ncbi:MAG: ABC transporter permease [Muribaculaceae bacterium]